MKDMSMAESPGIGERTKSYLLNKLFMSPKTIKCPAIHNRASLWAPAVSSLFSCSLSVSLRVLFPQRACFFNICGPLSILPSNLEDWPLLLPLLPTPILYTSQNLSFSLWIGFLWASIRKPILVIDFPGHLEELMADVGREEELPGSWSLPLSLSF